MPFPNYENVTNVFPLTLGKSLSYTVTEDAYYIITASDAGPTETTTVDIKVDNARVICLTTSYPYVADTVTLPIKKGSVIKLMGRDTSRMRIDKL